MNRMLIALGLGLVLGAAGWLIAEKEATLADGKLVLLELAPVDPRSLIQGDYMQLSYAIARDAFDADAPDDGYLILKLDADQVGKRVRFDKGEPLGEGELRLRYRQRHGSVRLGAESFFFQEGHADLFDKARYGELRVAANGESVLVGLRDAERRVLGPEDRVHH